MALYHHCHTCGAEYECIANYCPGCGKKLGRQPDPSTTVVTMTMEGTLIEPWWRCSGCRGVTNSYRPSYCPHCGRKVTEWHDDRAHEPYPWLEDK